MFHRWKKHCPEQKKIQTFAAFMKHLQAVVRTKYNIPIKDEWVTKGERQKRVKRFWIELKHS